VVGAVRHPIDSPDFSSFLVQAQGSGASVIGLANSGADTTVSIKQANEFGVGKRGVRLAPLMASIVNIDALGLAATQGLYLPEPFNPERNDGTRAWSARFFKQHGRMASFGQVGMYSAAYAYFKVLETMYAEDPASIHDGRKVAARLKSTPTDDVVYGKGRVREDGRHVHDMYLFKVKAPSESKGRWDYYTLVRSFPGEEAMFPAAESQCKLLRKKD
jgi:branched-chain amino acid transport system substrate-binding protein